MRSNILALRQRKADLTKQGKGILAVADREKRELTEGEELTHSRTVLSGCSLGPFLTALIPFPCHTDA